MTEGSKLDPAALDAYKTADPDEPTFTLQGGDPLAPTLVRAWALLARAQAGSYVPCDWMAGLWDMTQAEVSTNAKEQRELLLRATAAEEISWSMDEYRRGDRRDEPETSAENYLATEQQIDLHEYRKVAAAKLSTFFSEINIMREELMSKGAAPNLDGIMREAISLLRSIYNEVQPAEAKKLDDPGNW